MSTLLRLVRSEGIKRGLTFLASKDAKTYNIACRSVSSTPKKNDTATEEPYAVKKTWVSYGFDDDNIKADRHIMHQTLFVTISICLVFGAFVIGYMPDPMLKDWAQREAYLVLRHREENGLPLIDPNLIDPANIKLPSDEELGSTEITI